jgi:uncharacterized protein HemX
MGASTTTSSIAQKSTDTSSQQGKVEPTQQAVAVAEGLSTAAKVAIALSVALGALVLGIAVFIIYSRKKRKEKEHVEPAHQDIDGATDNKDDSQSYDKAELDAGHVIILSELDGLPMTPASELEGSQATWRSRESATEVMPPGSGKPESFVELCGDSIHLLRLETDRKTTSVTRKPVTNS